MIYYWERCKSEIQPIVADKIRNSAVIRDPFRDNGRHAKYLVLGSGFDIETSRIETPKFVTAYCYHWQFSLGRITIGGRSLETMVEFLKYLISLIPYGHRLLVFDANLGYEYQFCKHFWGGIGMSRLFTKEKRQPLRIIVGDRLEFRECLGLFGNNLAQIGENYSKVPKLKGDLDFTKVRLSTTPLTFKEQGYCENDVQILSYLGEYVFEHFYGDNPTLPMTATGIIRNKVKKELGDSLPFEKERIRQNLPDEQTYNMFRNYLFRGGICGTNARYMNMTLENVVCADFTSDYPACMNHYQFPDGWIMQISPEQFMEYPNIPYIAMIEFHDLKSKTTHSLMSVHKAIDFDFKRQDYTLDNNRVFKAKEITFIVNDIDFVALCKAYSFDVKKTRIIKAWRLERYKRLPHHVLDVLNSEYLKKEELKRKGLKDTLDYMDSKKVVNGMFGMTVTAIYNEEFDIYDDEIEPKRELDGTVFKKDYDEATESVFLNPFWGFWITSYARALLMDVITKFPKAIVQYDTDSIYYLKDHPDAPALEKYLMDYNNDIYDLNKIIFNGNEHYLDLGAWEIEKPYKRFKGLGSKRYMVETADGKIKTIVAGCRKGTIQKQYEWNLEHEAIASDTDIFDYFSDGMTISKELSGKLASKYIDDYDGELYRIEKVKDYMGHEEEIILSSAIVLEPIEFKMGLDDDHIDFFEMLQMFYRNAPKSSPICKIYEELVYGED